MLQDLENEARNKSRKHAEAHARLEQETDLTRAEYYTLKEELDKLVYTLRFSIEEELKIYQALLNSLDRQTPIRPSTDESTGFQLSRSSILRTNDVGSDRYGIQKNMLDQNQIKTTTTTRTTRRFAQESDGQQQININRTRSQHDTSELDEKYMQSKIHITRKYKGKRKSFAF
jgi:hypothetical protein